MNESILHERLGIMQLSSNLKSHGYDVKLVLAEREGEKGLLKICRTYSPNIVGFSAMTGEHLKLLEVNRYLKQHHKFISVFGGPHATFFPDFCEEKGVDAVCIGEGDTAFPEFCRRVDNNENYWETPNFWVKHKGDILRNSLLPLVENLDDLPYPDREIMYAADPELIPLAKYFFASRGCPYKCSYCFNDEYNTIYKSKGNIIRLRTPENFVDEISSVKRRYPLNVVYLDDDTFLVKPKSWFEKFSSLYKEKVNLPFSCNIRANLVDEETISILRDAGLDSAWMGVECGNEEVANNILGRNLKNSQILKAAEIIKKNGIKLITQNLVGIPVSNSYEVDLETIDLNIQMKPMYAWSSILYPYPGTQIAEAAKQNGFLDDSIPFLETNKRSTVFNFSKKEKRKAENLHKLFGLIVRFPRLRRAASFFCLLPLSGFYTAVFYLWYGYNLKIKILPFRSFFREIGSYFRLWRKFIKKT